MNNEIIDIELTFNFENVIKQLEKKLYFTALTILKNPEDAKDVLQDTILIAFQKYHKLKSMDAFPFWITKILLNESYKKYNYKKRFVNISEYEDFFVDKIDDYDLDFFDRISKLNKKDKIIVILRFYYGYSLEEISKIIFKPLSTTKSQLYRAIKKIELED